MIVFNFSCLFSKRIISVSAAFFLSLTYINCQQIKLYFDNFTTESGLSNNLVHNIYQDKKGWMWFGTYHGLNRFDVYKFTLFNHIASDSASLESSVIEKIFEDKDGNLWVGTEKKGLYLFNRNYNNLKLISGSYGKFNLARQTINAIKQDRDGLLWLGTDNGLCQIEPSGKILKLFQHQASNYNSINNNSIKVIHIDRANKIWVGTTTGLDLIEPNSGNIKHLRNSIPVLDSEISAIFQDIDSKLWIGTYNYGIVIIDPLTLKYEHLVMDPLNERSKTVRAIVRDDDKYWIGTRGGLYIYSRESNKYGYYYHDERESGSIIHNSVNDIFKDNKGDIWIATRGGISYIVKEKQVFQCYSALPNDTHYMNNGEIYTFWIDTSGKLWIGTESGGINVFDRKKGVFTYLTHNNSINSLSSNCIKALINDNKGNVWVGTFLGGIDIINLKTGHISHYQNRPEDQSSLSSNKVWALYMDSKDNIWIGTESGLDRFEPKTKTFIHCKNVIWNKSVIWIKEDSNNDIWIGSYYELNIYNQTTQKVKHFAEQTRMMHEDNTGRFWVTTLDKGLVLFDKDKGIIKKYDQSNGIANNQTYCILEDNNGYFWISTLNGLSRFDPKKEIFKNFDKLDGLQNNQFRYGACYKSPNGELIFGGITGFNIFNPAEIKENVYEHQIVLTNLKIFNKPVPIGNSKKSVLRKAISETKKITLTYDQNSLTFEFAALNYAKLAKNRYAYKLDGYEKEWNESGNQPNATYTNLNPGEYTFLVKASNSDNVWSKNNLELSIKILPPFWKTLWFEIIVVIVLLSLIYAIFRFMVNRNHLKHELVYERERAKKLHELDMMKVHFYANVSHELRTPLTLIISPLDKMLQTDMPEKEMKSYLSIMKRNTDQLLKMVNQLLDFRKIEAGNQKLELSKGDIVSFIRDIVSSFFSLSKEKSINLEFQTTENEIFTFFDADKIEKIINNLLSNSFKFTPEGGSVNLRIALETDDREETTDGSVKNGKFIEIVVKDTGTGIPENHLNKIFNRFFQSGNAKNHTGTGIGLALTRELVKIHNGRIFVESSINKGSKFTVRLPLNIYSERETPELMKNRKDGDVNSEETDMENSQHQELEDKRILLIVDDNADVRFFIRSNFESDFSVLEAANGKEGLSLAFKYLPDIIISDILMPGIDGKEFCKRLKKDERTSHIPVILLTALSSKSHEKEGMVVGADDYITKPFDIALLKTKVENLLILRNMLREKYSGELVLKPKNIIIENPDERFLAKVIEIIEKNIIDPEFDIDKLSQEVGVSRTQMYRKMSALTDMTVREFVKNIRLKRAAQLLEQDKMNVSEVAFAVGFKDLSHFRKCFRQEYGMSASEYASRHTG